MGFDPLRGYSRLERQLNDSKVKEGVKEIAQLDGALELGLAVQQAVVARDGQHQAGRQGQLVADGGGWKLRALNPAYAETHIGNLSHVRGVVIQKSRPGSRRARKRYID